MSELLQAAKAVIYDWDKYQQVQHESVNMLCAAVERAEKQKPVRLSDEEIQECFDISQKNFSKHQTGIKGQQLTIRDWPNWHFAKAIEQAVLEKNK